ncbi:MAG: FHA domain-containing protein [Schlesneria sp.]
MESVAAYLLMTNVSHQEWQAPVFTYSQVIGRLPECDIVIPKEYVHVSRQHAEVGADKDGLWIQDLGSSGGTQLNGVPLVPSARTRAEIGDRVSLGGLELYFVSPDASILEESVGEAEEEGKTRSTVQFTARSIKTVGDVRLSSLSPAELEIVRWICRGLTTFEEIGRKLFRSPHTVRTQLGSVFKKLDVHSREQLLALMRKCEIAWTQPESNGAEDTIGPIKRDH